MPSQHYHVGSCFHSLNIDVIMCGLLVNTIIIDFCLYFSLGVLTFISESTEELLWDNERIKWCGYGSSDYFGDDYY